MKRIFLKPDAPLPYTKTQIPFDRSILDIKALLKKFGADEIIVYENGKEEVKIAFRKGGVPYIIEIPVIYIEGPKTPARLSMDISGRIVYNRIKTILLDVELGTLSFMQAMLRNVALPSPQGLIPLGDIVEAQQDKIIKGQVEFDPSKIKLLEEGKDVR